MQLAGSLSTTLPQGEINRFSSGISRAMFLSSYCNVSITNVSDFREEKKGEAICLSLKNDDWLETT